MIICCDIDEILENLMESVLIVYNSRHDTHYTVDDCLHFNLYENFPVEVADEMFAMFGDPDVRKILKPREGAQWGIETLMQMGHNVYFATATRPDNIGWKSEWVLNNFKGTNYKQIIDIYDKGLLNVDVLIDDNIENLKAGMYERICLDAQWNRDVRDDVYDIYRCNSWREIINTINTIDERNKEIYG